MAAQAKSKPAAKAIPRPPTLIGECAAEALGTMIILLFGNGVVASVVAAGVGDHDSIAWAWGLGVVLAIFVANRASGAHLNPAVTLSLALFGGFSWRKVAPYVAAQTFGAFIAALLVRWNYSEVIAKVDGGHTSKTLGIFCTFPGNGEFPVSSLGAFRDQIIGTAILVFLVFAITDKRNSAPLANMAPLFVGLTVVAIGMAWGVDAGYAINPARDFGPRLAAWFTGYDTAWRDQYGDLYFWVPILGPLIGGPVGAALYRFGVTRYLPPEEPDEVLEPETARN